MKYDNLNIYNTLLVLSVFKSMSVQINYKTASSKKKSSNLVFFVDENFNITPLKKFISNREYSYISDLHKINDKKKKIIAYDINSTKKIILVSHKKKMTSSETEGLGAKFYKNSN